MALVTLAAVLGGVGLLLLGMHLVTEGLRMAAGRTLARILERSTATPARGLLSGALLTAVVQSSSAVTVAIIGFVNAGVVGLRQALSVVYGSNLGTTMTGWLVAAIGFHLNGSAFALPAIGGGMLTRLLARGRAEHFGSALAGFGVFFLGIDVLTDGFAGVRDAIPLASLAGGGAGAVLLSVGAGFALTVLVQSSSAAIALVLTAAGGGGLPIDVAAGAVIGANLGTTSTAALSALGATPNAKRVAAGHIVFNAVTGVVALAILPVLLFALSRLEKALDLGSSAAILLALFHTTFNLLGIAIFWPFTGRLASLLERLFRSALEDEARPRYLDRNVLSTPALASRALAMELARMGEIARRAARSALVEGEPPSRPIEADRGAVESLVEVVGDFATGLSRGRVGADVAAGLAEALRVARHFSEVAELATQLATARREQAPIEAADLRDEERRYLDAVARLLEALDSRAPGFTPERAGAQLELVEKQYHATKSRLLEAGARAGLPVRVLVEHLDALSHLRRLSQQAELGESRLAALAAEMAPPARTPVAPAR